MISFTEEEARDKYCPFDVKGFCVGPRCMAWKWTEFELSRGGKYVVDDKDKPLKGNCGVVSDG